MRKSYLDVKESAKFSEKSLRRNLNDIPILSTGGYNDTILKMIANQFNTEIVKCREYLRFIITAIDYMNKWTNDCFFTFD